ncbi:MAG: hypothetical protein Q7T26_10480 [Dehalococcoidia bacterium]|nr:hypothetical protein [Dehalococcoidia bacterium]
MSDEEALARGAAQSFNGRMAAVGVEEKAREFRESGGRIYRKA